MYKIHYKKKNGTVETIEIGDEFSLWLDDVGPHAEGHEGHINTTFVGRYAIKDDAKRLLSISTLNEQKPVDSA